MTEIPRLERMDPLPAPGALHLSRVDDPLPGCPNLLMPPAITAGRRPGHQTPVLAAARRAARQCRSRQRSSQNLRRSLRRDGRNVNPQASQRRGLIGSARRSASNRAASRSARWRSHKAHPSGPSSTTTPQRTQLNTLPELKRKRQIGGRENPDCGGHQAAIPKKGRTMYRLLYGRRLKALRTAPYICRVPCRSDDRRRTFPARRLSRPIGASPDSSASAWP